MIKLICRPEHEAQRRVTLKPFEALYLTLVLSGGVQLEVSRSYAPHFRKAIGMEGKR